MTAADQSAQAQASGEEDVEFSEGEDPSIWLVVGILVFSFAVFFITMFITAG